MRKSKLLTLFFACFAGAGQMYLGYMKRGASFMLSFVGIFVVAGSLGVQMLLVLMPVVWAYAFFDTFHLAECLRMQQGVTPDAWFVKPERLLNEDFLNLFGKRHILVGWGLIGIGAYAIYSNLVADYLWQFFYDMQFMIGVRVINSLPTLILAGLLILLGLRLLKAPEPKQDDYVAFKGDITND